jgi:excisionase family DNA binding protein
MLYNIGLLLLITRLFIKYLYLCCTLTVEVQKSGALPFLFGTMWHTKTQRGTIGHKEAQMSSKIEVTRICQHCGDEFTARTTSTRYCSHRCNRRGYKANLKALKVEVSNKQTQQIKNRPIEELKAKPYLSIAETCKLVGISRRTVCRMIQRGELSTGKAGRRIIIRRTDLEQRLFKTPLVQYLPSPTAYPK